MHNIVNWKSIENMPTIVRKKFEETSACLDGIVDIWWVPSYLEKSFIQDHLFPWRPAEHYYGEIFDSRIITDPVNARGVSGAFFVDYAYAESSMN